MTAFPAVRGGGNDRNAPGGATRPTAMLAHGYVAFGIVMAVVYFVIPAAPADLVVWPIIGWSSVVAILVGVAFNHPHLRLPWFLFAAGVALQVVGDALYSIDVHVRHAVVPFPSYIDLAYVGTYPLVIAGVALIVRHRTSGRDRSSLIDAGIITVSAGLLSWVLLIAPYVRSVDLVLPERLISIAYPIGDIVLFASVARLAVGGGHRTIAYWLLGASVIPMLTADTLYSYLTLGGTYPEHSFVEAGWIAFYVGWGAAALHPSMRALSEATPNTVRIGTVRLIAIGSAVLVPPVMLFTQGAFGDVSDATPIAVAAAVLLVLVLIRIARLAREGADAKSEARFLALIDKSSDAIVVLDGKGRIRYHTRSTERLLGLSVVDLAGTSFGNLLDESDALRLTALLASDIASTTTEWRVRHTQDGWRDLEVTADDLRGTSELGGIVFTMRDVTDRKRFDREFRRQTLHDSLTGLPNRTLFIDRVEQALKRARRGDASVIVLILNLDDFKIVNDSLGPAAGDDLLVAVAARLTATSRNDPGVARLGGDEFAFLFEIADADGASELAAVRIQSAMRAPFRVGGNDMPVHASYGIAVGSPWTHTADQLLRDADLAMSFAKRKGKDRVELFLPAMHEEASRRLEVAAELLGGIERNEFVVHYLPIVELHSGRITGVESLVRWQHPRRGLLEPRDFLPMAEVTGLIGPLGLWVLKQACLQTRAWNDEGITDDSFYVSVNLAAQHVQDPDLVRHVREALGAADLAPAALVLEIAETALIHDMEMTGASLTGFRELGVRVAIDDFGTGSASLAHLIRLPIDFIKLDRSLIDLVDRAEGERMVRAILDFADTLGLEAVAEGIELGEQLRTLQDLGCRLGQGFFLSMPLSAGEIGEALERQSIGGVALAANQPA